MKPLAVPLALLLLASAPALAEPALLQSGTLLIAATSEAVLTLEEDAPASPRAGQVLRASLAAPIFAQGTLAVPAGTPAKVRLETGPDGRLAPSAQWLDLRGERIPLTGFAPIPAGTAPPTAWTKGQRGLATVTRDTRVAPAPATLPGGP
jgi:hypothetical protein